MLAPVAHDKLYAHHCDLLSGLWLRKCSDPSPCRAVPREVREGGAEEAPLPAKTTAETLTASPMEQSQQPIMESAVPAVAAPPAAEEPGKALKMTLGKGEGGTDPAARSAAEAEVALQVLQAAPQRLGTQLAGEQLPPGQLQADAESGTLPAMAALAPCTMAEPDTALDPPAASSPLGDAADPGATDASAAGAAPELTGIEISRNSSSGQRPAEGAQEPAALVAAAVAAVESAPPAGARDWNYAALPADVAARLAQIDAENAARMRAPAQTGLARAAPAAVAEASPTLTSQVGSWAQPRLLRKL